MNIRTHRPHAILMHEIKSLDSHQDLTKTGIFERAIRAARGVDWRTTPFVIKKLLLEYKDLDVPVFTSFKIHYSDETGKLLERIIQEITSQLELKVIQKQYLLQLLLANYILYLRAQQLKPQSDNLVDEDLSMPDIVKILVEMMLTDSKCKELEQISKILINWNRRKGEYEFKETISKFKN